MSCFYTNVYARLNKIYIRGWNNGKRFQDECDYTPYLFVPGNGEYRTVDGIPCVKKQFESITAARAFVKQMEGVDNFQFYGMTQFSYTAINDEFPGIIEYDPQMISVVSIDIEVHSPNEFPEVVKADKMVSAITLIKKDKSISFGIKPYKTHDNETYILCKDEKDLLKKFLTVWNDDEWSPDVVTGWNIEMFDMPYLINRVRNILGKKWVAAFSPWGYVYEREIIRGKYASSNFDDRKEVVYDITGITQLDYLQLYKKFTFTNHESYALGHIAHTELGEGKIDFSEARSLADLYEKNHDKYIEYNIHDARLVQRLEEKLGFIQLVFALAYKAKVNYVDTLTTLRNWDVIIHNHLLAKNIVIPQPSDKNFRMFEGAFVKEVQIGMHKWVVSFDLTSLYPSLISQCNISPETFDKKFGAEMLITIDDILKVHSIPEGVRMIINEKNWSLAANGCVYRKDQQGFLGELVDTFIADRATIKKKMQGLKKKQDPVLANEIQRLHNYQWALKILTNGLYGALGNRYFRWFDVDLAESITKTGQLAVRWIMGDINDYLNKTLSTKDVDYIIAGDTDSVYINLEPMVKACNVPSNDTIGVIRFLDKVCQEKLEPFIERRFLALSKMLGSYNHKLVMKRESICNKGIWRGKKMYILNVWNEEGIEYKTPKLKIKGIEAVRSTTPMVCRKAIRETLSVIMNKEETDLHKYVANFETTFMKLPFEDIATPTSLNGLDQYSDPQTIYKLHCPIHVKGAILYNKLLIDKKLTNKYQTIHNKDKIKYTYLKKPNPINEHVIGAFDELPEEFGLTKYIDKEMQFEKKFLSPIKSITNVIGWNTEKQSSLTRFFKGKV